ncbi:MAG TPA: hypothetical protein VHP58_04035 [Alphaproteobacteria bacterium]|nr:hypothetical protein [Alphaproteobacteria bacterium]
MLRLAGLMGLLLLYAGAARAELRVAEEDGAPAITSRDTLVAFTTPAGELWVVAPQGPLMIDHETARKAGWQVEALKVQGGVGVQIKQAKAAQWRLRIMPWGWKVVEGDAKKLPPVRLNMVKLKDGLTVEGQTTLNAQNAAGEHYWVVPAAGPVPGGVETLSGLAVAANQPLKAASVGTKLTAVPPAVPLEPEAPAPETKGKVATTFKQLLAKVPMFPAKPLAAVATPLAAVETMVKEDVAPIMMHHAEAAPVQAQEVAAPVEAAEAVPAEPMVKGAYALGSLVPFTLPEEWMLQDGKLVSAEKVRRGEARARALGSLEVALDQTRKLAAKLPVEAPVDTARLPVGVAPTGNAVEAKGDAAAPAPVSAGQALVWPDVKNVAQYLPALQAQLAKLSRAPGAQKPQLREELAIFYVAWGRGVEAMTAIATNPGAPSNRAQFVQALALLEEGQPAAALEKLNGLASRNIDDRYKQNTAWQTHLNIWRAVALSDMGRNADALKTWPADVDALETYPKRLQEMARLDYASALVAVGQLADARAYADLLAKKYPPAAKGAEQGPARLSLLRGLARLNTRDEKEGLRILAAVAEQKDDLKTAYQAKFAFVQALQRRGELALPQYIRYLGELARFWRGDVLETQVLRELGKQYMVNRDYRAALTAWRDLVRVAPTLPDMADLTDQMTAALVAAFDPESPAAYDPLEYLGMYYDFKELVPADDRGDRIAERVVELLLQLGLPERARVVADQLLKFRLKDPVSQGRVSLLLAQAQRETGDAAASLNTLDKWSAMMTTSIQKQQWQVAEARALTDLGQLDSAQKVLRDRDDLGVQQVRADVAWQKQDWKTLAATLHPVVQELNPATVSGSLPLSVVKLAYAETENGNVDMLSQLQKKWSGVGGDNSAAVFSTLAGTLGVTPSAVLAQQSLGQVAGSLAAAEQLTNRIKDEHRQTAAERKEREDYDNKMRYMELLPPPRI